MTHPVPFTLIDSHCHLEPEDFRRRAEPQSPAAAEAAAQDPESVEWIDERPAVLARAHAAGLRQFVVIGSGQGAAEVRNAVTLARNHPELFAAVGVHPHDARTIIAPEAPHERATPGPRGEALWQEIADLAATEPRVVAVGETGLDYFYKHSPQEEQVALFRRTLRLSAAVGKPAILHIRDAHPEALRIVREEGAPAGGVVHCFTAGPDEARAWLELGFYISLSGIVTFKTATSIQAAARLCPADRLLLETDCPYLAPNPHRGKRNEPAFLIHTATFVAGLRGVELAQLAAETTAAARALFRLPTTA